MFYREDAPAGLVVPLVFELIFFCTANLEIYHFGLVEVPAKERLFVGWLIFVENFTKVVFWGFFIQLTKPGGVWGIVIAEFFVGFIIEVTC